MASINIYIKLDDYLAQWFKHEQGGNVPIKLIRGSVESNILEQFLQTPPAEHKPVIAPDLLPIIIPSFKYKNPEYYHYLPKKAEDLLVSCIRNRFDIDMWTTLHKFSSLHARQDELIYAFMENHGIDINEKNFNAIAKRYQRKRKSYQSAIRMKKMRDNRSENKH